MGVGVIGGKNLKAIDCFLVFDYSHFYPYPVFCLLHTRQRELKKHNKGKTMPSPNRGSFAFDLGRIRFDPGRLDVAIGILGCGYTAQAGSTMLDFSVAYIVKVKDNNFASLVMCINKCDIIWTLLFNFSKYLSK